MIRARKLEEMNPELLKRFSNENLVVEQSRISRLTQADREELRKVAFTNYHKYYSPEALAKLLRKAIYQRNFDESMRYELFRAINSVLVNITRLPKNEESPDDKALRESAKGLSDLFELMFFLGDSESDGLLHDETKGGWHHPMAILDDDELELSGRKPDTAVN